MTKWVSLKQKQKKNKHQFMTNQKQQIAINDNLK